MGETYSNVFNGLSDELEFANVYFNDRRQPLNDICSRYYCVPYYKYVGFPDVTNHSMLRYIFDDEAAYCSDWGKSNLYQFIDEFNPNIIMVSAIFGEFGNRIVLDIINKCNVPVVYWLWDDTFNCFEKNVSFFAHIKELTCRRLRKKIARCSSIIYTICPHMQDEYNIHFGNKCLLLNKGYDFSCSPNYPVAIGAPIKLVYMGTLCNERDKTLFEVIDALERLNRDGFNMVLEVYSTSARTQEYVSKINRSNISTFKEIVGPEDKMGILRDADILLHLEPFSESKCKIYRLSLSSKIVDYFYAARCIVSIGGVTGTVEYLLDNDAAIIEEKKENIYDLFRNIYNERSIIYEYAKKSWSCGELNHNINIIQKNLCSNLKHLVG